jgi:hypothetical protein
MTQEQEHLILALRRLRPFGLILTSISHKVKRNCGKGRPPKKVLVRTLNRIYAKLPRPRKWHEVANEVVSAKSHGELRKTTYAAMARSIKWKVDQIASIKKKPTIATIEGWLKTHKSVNPSILDFRRIRQKSHTFSG